MRRYREELSRLGWSVMEKGFAPKKGNAVKVDVMTRVVNKFPSKYAFLSRLSTISLS